MPPRSLITFLLLIALPLLTLAKTDDVSSGSGSSPSPSHRSPNTTSASGIDFARSHYNPDTCGLPATGRARRHGGDDYVDGMDFRPVGEALPAKGDDAPWAVAIVTKGEPRLCSGTLISTRHVLSAAHCLLANTPVLPIRRGHARCHPSDYKDLNDFMDDTVVNYGGECLSADDEDCTEDTVAKTARIKNITLFNFFLDHCAYGSDLVIFELDQDVDVPHACLPHLHDVSLEMNANYSTFSWGGASSSDASSQRLRKVSLELVRDICTPLESYISPDHLCAAPQKPIGRCGGDSGSGLLTTAGRRAFLAGVLSSSAACAAAKPESRFTDVRLFSATLDVALGTVGAMLDGRTDHQTLQAYEFKHGVRIDGVW